jgi:asparagine synthase (glutamine-hydrolysing)
MCGFVGVFNKKGIPDIDLKIASNKITTRGPDMQGIKSGQDWKVAFNRLSIHDLSDNGMQPFEYNGVIVYLNGEIYNYIELLESHKDEFSPKSGSDVEIIPFLYRKYGISFLNKLNGMFAIVIIDEFNNQKYLVRDRFAQKPLYYYLKENNLYFASEVKAIKEIVDLKVDKLNLKINFSCGFLPQPLSLYKDTFSISPGSFIKFEGGEIIEKRWYNPKIKKCNDSKEVISKKFIELFKSSIDLRLRSDVPVGIFLSGGLDSTSMAKFANEQNKKEFFAFGAEIVGKEEFEKNNTDVEIPSRLSNDLNFNYKKTTLNYNYYNQNIVKFIKHYDEIFMSSGVLVFYALSKLAKENNTSVILTGAAGDELFGGYPWQSGVLRKIDKIFKLTYGKVKYSELIYKMLLKINSKLALAYKALFNYKLWHTQSFSDFNMLFNKSRIEIEKRLEKYASEYFNVTDSHLEYKDIYNIMNYTNIFTVIGTQNHFIDIVTMHYSVENRSPLLDYRIVEYMMGIPDNIKTQNGLKGLLRDILDDYLPEYVTKAKKSGPTMPLMTWFYDDESLLNDIKKFVFKYIDIIEEYLSSDISEKIKLDDEWLFKRDNAIRLFSVLSFIIWARFNILEDILDENITFEELIRGN